MEMFSNSEPGADEQAGFVGAAIAIIATEAPPVGDSDIRGRNGQGGGEGGGGDGARGRDQPGSSATEEERKDAELEKRRQDRAAQAAAK